MWFPLESYDPTRAPQTGDVLSDRFQQALPGCVGLWLPAIDDRGKALDFNPNPIKNLGALNGGVATSASGWGRISQSWKLNGSTGCINFGTNPALDFTSSGALSILVIRNSAADQVYACKGDVFNDRNCYGIYEFHGSLFYEIGSASAANQINGGPVPAIGVAALLTLTFDGSTVRAYINGSQVNSTSQTISASPSGLDFVLGANGGSSPSNFAAISVLFEGAWPRALTATQISALDSCLRSGEPFPLFQPQVGDLAFGSAAAPAGKVPWPLFMGRAA